MKGEIIDTIALLVWTVTLLEFKIRFFKNRILVAFLFSALYSSLIFAQDQAITINGRITYLTTNLVYTDIGSEHGAEVGDTLSVFRRNEEIGLIVITNLANRHSACKLVLSADSFQLGDNLEITKLQTRLPIKERTDIADEKSEKTETLPRIRKPTHKGSIALRSSYFGRSSKYGNSNRTVSTLQYKFNLDSPVKSQVSIFARSDLSDPEITIYHVQVTLGQNQDTYQAAFGRIYSYELAPVGATDGLLLSRKLSPKFSVGALFGLQPNPQSLNFNDDRKKSGIFASLASLKREFLSTIVKFNGSAAYISENYLGETDRELFYLRMNSSFGRKIDLRYSQTIDFDRNNALPARGNAEITDLNFSAAVRLTGRVSITSRISTRKQIRYLVSQPVTPDSSFIDAARTGFNNVIKINTRHFGYFRIGSNIRTETNSRRNSYVFFLDYRKHMANQKSINVRFSYLNNLISTSLKTRLSYNSPFFFNLISQSWIELHNYGFVGRGLNNNRFTFSENIDWRVGSGYYLSLIGEYFIDKNFDQLHILFQTSYRF